MDLPIPPQEASGSKGKPFGSGLTRSLVQRLLLLALIPLTLMAWAAYLQARTLLQAQAVTQMQTLITQQLSQVELSLKTKSIRLDRLIHRADLASLIEQALHANRQGSEF